MPPNSRRPTWWPLQLLCLVLLWAAPVPRAAAECGQITTWSQADFAAALFPTVIAINAPGTLPGNPSGTGPATSIAAVPQPAGVRTLANNTSITIYSLASAANAAAYYAYRRAQTVLPAVHEQAGEVFAVTGTLRQGSLTDLYLTARYGSTVILVAGYADASQTMASGSAVSLYLGLLGQAQALVDSKCGQANRAPTISLAPDPAAAPAFQEVMTSGHEFEIRVDDPDGIGDIDPASLRVWVAGIDKTRHFLETVAAHPSRLRQVGTATGVTFFLRPDPQRLMTDLNYFNIQWNGKWPVSLGICDRQGACARADYTIYFGPYFAITPATFLGQPGGACVGAGNQLPIVYILGNSGYGSQFVDLYIGLQRSSDGALWTYGRIDIGANAWHSPEIVWVWNWPDAPSGVRIVSPREAVLTMQAGPTSPSVAAGEYGFLTVAVEPDATDLLLVARTAVICGR